jgi:L-iditol 2-dehydrogenase
VKIARLYNYSDIRIEDVAIPEIGEEDALVMTKACGICSGDVMQWYIEKKAPLVLGHEPAGEIVKIGSKVRDNLPFSIGEKVFVHHHAPCMSCRYCRRRDFVQCDTWRNSRITPGGISEYFIVPKINLLNDTLKIPDGLSCEDGALIEPVACVVKSLKRALIKKGDTILIIGLGFMGQVHVILSRFFGVHKIIGADLIPFRLNKALEFGADSIIDVSKQDIINSVRNLTEGRMADVVIVCPNSIQAIEKGLDCVAKGGTLMLFTPVKPDELLAIDLNYIYFRDINITTSYSCGPEDTWHALKFIQKGAITAKALVTHRFPIEEAEKAYRITAEAKDSLKCMILF